MSKVLLGDVAVEHKETCKGSKEGYPIVGLEHLIPEEITLTAWDEGSENTFTKMFRKGNVLFGRRRAYLKKAAVAPFDGICSGDITVIEAKPDRILPELLPFIIQNDALFDFAVGKSAGSLSPRVKWEHLKNYEFELPDMDKQKELATLLWAMDETKKSYQKLIAATDELVKSQFVELFGAINDDVPLSYYIASLNAGKSLAGEEECPNKVLKTGAATYDYFDATQVKNLPLDYEPQEDHRVSAGDVIISRMNTAELVGAAAYVWDVPERVYLPDRLWRAEIKDAANAIFVWQVLIQSSTKESIRRIASGTSGSMKNISKPGLLGIRVVKAPISLQEQFAAFVEQTDKSKFELEQALAALTATYKRIIAENLG